MTFNTGDEKFPEILDTIFREQDVRKRVSTEEADSLELVDWVVLFKEQIDTLRVSDDWKEIFDALLQIRHFSQRALMAHVRKSLDDRAA